MELNNVMLMWTCPHIVSHMRAAFALSTHGHSEPQKNWGEEVRI